MKIFKNTYLTNRFFLLFAGVALLFVACFPLPRMLPFVQTMLAIAIVVALTDMMLLFRRQGKFEVKRTLPKMLSLGSENPIRIHITNLCGTDLSLQIIDELPVQFQQRNFSLHLRLRSGESSLLNYILRPLSRGEYVFHNVNIFAQTALGLIERKFPVDLKQRVSVYPSIMEMKAYELKAMSRISNFHGIKKLRRLGQSYEFEQIKNYVLGDDYRSINWKATSRKAELMVNQFEDEKAQQVYSIIDASRGMHMPFNGLSLLDYAINSTLVISNIALIKHDKVGLLTFFDRMDKVIRADKGKGHLRMILEGLYNQHEHNLEPNYELLYLAVRNSIRGRSLLFLYTNFESYSALERVLPIIRKLNKLHLLVLVFFENTEVLEYSAKESRNVEEIYLQTIAQKFVSEKKQIVNELRQYGIQVILTRPENLSISTVNKYLELKSRGMI